MVIFRVLNEGASCADKWRKTPYGTQRHQRFGGHREKRNSRNQTSKDMKNSYT